MFKFSKQPELKLDLNEKILPPENAVLKKISRLLNVVNFYPRAEDCERTAKVIANFLGVKPANVVIANGSYHALDIIFSFLVGEQDEVIIPVPTFPFYTKFEKYHKFKIKKLYYHQDFSLSVDEIIEAIGPQTKIIYLVNPQNPLGVVLPTADIIRLIQKAKEKGVLVVLDEAYVDFHLENLTGEVEKYDNLIVLRTFSKCGGLGGLKLGCAIANPQLAKELNELRGPTFALSNIAMGAGNLVLAEKQPIADYAANIRASKKILMDFLKEQKIEYIPSEASYIVIRPLEPEKLVKTLRAKNILIKDLSDYPDGEKILKGCIRITIPPLKYAAYFIKNFKEALKEL